VELEPVVLLMKIVQRYIIYELVEGVAKFMEVSAMKCCAVEGCLFLI